jgi:hypothetical protein
VGFQAPALAPEASLAAESLAMDQKYKEKDKRSRCKEPLSPRLVNSLAHLVDGVDSSSKPH